MFFVGLGINNRLNIFSVKYIIYIVVLISITTACQTQEKSKKELFERYVNQFELVNLPIDTNLLYRVHNNPIVKNRIDTTYVQNFINEDYQLRLDMPVYEGYAYGLRLPREEYDYESLIHYESSRREQFFVLNTYKPNGTLLSSLSFSGDSSSYKRVVGEIGENRMILLRAFILNQPDSVSKEMIFEIENDGTIMPMDTFYTKN